MTQTPASAGPPTAEGADERAVFSRLRLDGERFSGHKLPIAALRELERYENLVIDVAAANWKAANPGRSNLPGHFRDGFHLVIADLEEGSVVPVLERQESSTAFNEYYEEAAITIEAAFEALGLDEPLPSAYNWADSRDFVDFGSTLLSDESIFFRPNDPDPVVYSPAIRARALRRLEPREIDVVVPQERPGVIVGRLVALDADAKSFSIRLLGNLKISGKYSDAGLTQDMREVLDSSATAPVIRVTGSMLFQGTSTPQKIVNAAEVSLFEVDGQPWSARLIELAGLEPGWRDGYGERVQFPALDAARDLLSKIADEGLPIPGIFPMEDGGVQLEWASPGSVTSVEIAPEMEFSLFHLGSQRGLPDELDTEDFTVAVDFLRQAVS